MTSKQNQMPIGREPYKNKICPFLLGFVVGIAVMFVASWYYFGGNPKDDTPPLFFTPNAMAERKPMDMQILKTQQDVDAVKATKIYLSEQASIGAGIRLGTRGLSMYLKKELDQSDIHVKDIGPQLKDKVIVGNYTYIPNAIVTVDPSPVQILDTPEDVARAKKIEGLLYGQHIVLGGAISCKPTFPCYALSKKEIEDRIVIKRFSTRINNTTAPQQAEKTETPGEKPAA